MKIELNELCKSDLELLRKEINTDDTYIKAEFSMTLKDQFDNLVYTRTKQLKLAKTKPLNLKLQQNRENFNLAFGEMEITEREMRDLEKIIEMEELI